jgi:hypothetical protein
MARWLIFDRHRQTRKEKNIAKKALQPIWIKLTLSSRPAIPTYRNGTA